MTYLGGKNAVISNWYPSSPGKKHPEEEVGRERQVMEQMILATGESAEGPVSALCFCFILATLEIVAESQLHFISSCLSNYSGPSESQSSSFVD